MRYHFWVTSWCILFGNGRIVVDDYGHKGWPLTVTSSGHIGRIREINIANRHITTDDILFELNCLNETGLLNDAPICILLDDF